MPDEQGLLIYLSIFQNLLVRIIMSVVFVIS